MTAAFMAMIALPLAVAAALVFTSWAEKRLLREDATTLPRTGDSAPSSGAHG